MFIIISDECGDTGLSYSKGTKSFISGTMLTEEKNLLSINNIARSISRKYLNSPLRKWSDLKGVAKNNPNTLYDFISEFSKTAKQNNIFIYFSIFILNKQENEIITRTNQKEMHEYFIWRGYELCFKRIFSFVKKYGFTVHDYDYSIKWCLDRNIQRESQIEQAIKNLANQKNIRLDGPHFISKRPNDSSLHELSTSIKIVDIIIGIMRKSFEYYLNCNNDCKLDNCVISEDCQNNFIGIWNIFRDNFLSIKIELNHSKIWDWQGIIYQPQNFRNNHKRFIGNDDFFI